MGYKKLSLFLPWVYLPPHLHSGFGRDFSSRRHNSAGLGGIQDLLICRTLYAKALSAQSSSVTKRGEWKNASQEALLLCALLLPWAQNCPLTLLA